MKTIRPPKLPRTEDRVYRIACNNKECEALLEMGHAELSHSHSCDPRENVDYSQFTCPHCKKFQTVYKLKTYLVPQEQIPRGDFSFFVKEWS